MTERVDTIEPVESEVFGDFPYYNRLFRMLSSQSCRYAIYYFLAAEGSTATLEDLTRGVQCIAGHASKRRCLVGDDRLRSLLVSKTIPELSHLDVLEYDPRSDTVRYCHQPTVVEFAEHTAYQELCEPFVRQHFSSN